jgi:hypothetical protein
MEIPEGLISDWLRGEADVGGELSGSVLRIKVLAAKRACALFPACMPSINGEAMAQASAAVFEPSILG